MRSSNNSTTTTTTTTDPASKGKIPPPLPDRGDSSSSLSSSSSLTGSTRPELKNPQQVLIHQVEFLLTIGAAEDWDHSTIDISELTTALSPDNVALLEKTPQGKEVLVRARLTLNIRLSLIKEDWKQLAEQLSTCSKLDITSPEISSAQDELAYHQEVEETCTALRLAVENKSVKELEEALTTADLLKIQGHDGILGPARNTLAEWKLAVQLVEEAHAQKNYFLLLAAINTCQTADFTSPVVYAAAVLLARIVRVRELSLLGLHYVERTFLEEAVALAKELGYVEAKLLGRAAELLALKNDQFVRAQYQTALSQKDQARADSLSVKMKEHFFLMHLDSFDWRHFPNLRPASEFKSLSLFGRGKQQQRSMLRWTDTGIPTSLTRLEQRGLIKAATKLFQKVLTVVNDGSLKTPVRQQLQQEIVGQGFVEPKLRDELFLQLLKMMTDTPHRDAHLRARELLCFALQCFPPSREFDPYLESFLHRTDAAHTAPVASKDSRAAAAGTMDLLLSMLHDTQFGYNGKKPPTIASLVSEKHYRPKILADPPLHIDPGYLSSIQEDRPDFDWLQHEQTLQQISEILAYPVYGQQQLQHDHNQQQPHFPKVTQSTSVLPSVSNTSAASTTTTATTTTSSSTTTSHHEHEAGAASRIDVLDVEALLKQWDDLAVEVAKQKEQDDESSSYSSSDSDSGSDSGFETDEGFQKYRVKAVYEYVPDGPGKIGLKVGHTFTVSGKQSGGWLLGKNETTGERGYFPEAYSQAI